VETKVEEYASQLPAEEVTKIKELIQNTREVLAKKDDLSSEAIRTSTNNLQQASLKLFELAYRKMAADREGGSSSSSSESKSEPEASETAEEKEKKEKKN